MTDMPMFREPGQDQTFTDVPAVEHRAPKPHETSRTTETTETIVPLPHDNAKPDTAAKGTTTERPAGGRAKKRQSPRHFPVNTVTAHPKALAKAKELIADNPSYTKITPGDVPGSVIIR